MSKTFEGVVSDLRDLGSFKIKEINVLFDGHQKWLEETVNDLKRRIDALGPPDKRHRISNDASKVQLHVNNQQTVKPSSERSRPRRRHSALKNTLETVAEEEEGHTGRVGDNEAGDSGDTVPNVVCEGNHIEDQAPESPVAALNTIEPGEQGGKEGEKEEPKVQRKRGRPPKQLKLIQPEEPAKLDTEAAQPQDFDKPVDAEEKKCDVQPTRRSGRRGRRQPGSENPMPPGVADPVPAEMPKVRTRSRRAANEQKTKGIEVQVESIPVEISDPEPKKPRGRPPKARAKNGEQESIKPELSPLKNNDKNLNDKKPKEVELREENVTDKMMVTEPAPSGAKFSKRARKGKAKPTIQEPIQEKENEEERSGDKPLETPIDQHLVHQVTDPSVDPIAQLDCLPNPDSSKPRPSSILPFLKHPGVDNQIDEIIKHVEQEQEQEQDALATVLSEPVVHGNMTNELEASPTNHTKEDQPVSDEVTLRIQVQESPDADGAEPSTSLVHVNKEKPLPCVAVKEPRSSGVAHTINVEKEESNVVSEAQQDSLLNKEQGPVSGHKGPGYFSGRPSDDDNGSGPPSQQQVENNDRRYESLDQVHSVRMQDAFHSAELGECRVSGTPFESPFESPEGRGGSGIEQTPRDQQQQQQQQLLAQKSKSPDRTIQNIPKEAGVRGGGGGEGIEHPESNAQASNAPSQTAPPKGLAANLVSTIRSFLPASKSQVSASQSPTAQQAGIKKPVPRVKALEAAEAAKKREEEKNAERARQKQEAERIRQERLKKARAVADEQQKKGVLVHKDGFKELARPHPLQQGTSTTKPDNQQRPCAIKNPASGFSSTSANTKPHAAVPPKPFSATSGAASLAEAKQRLAKIQQQAVILQQRQATSNSEAVLANASQNCSKPQAGVPSRPAPQTYEISPYKSDFDSEGEDEPRKPVPEWARGRSLMAQLVAQMHIDPDEVFQQHAKTCSLDEVFAAPTGKPGKRDFTRRSSSGNWLEDRVTWKEELGYKKAMGYI